MKTLEQIRERIKAIGPNDPHGFGIAALAEFDPDSYGESLRGNCPELTEASVRKTLLDYLQFAFVKAIDHRGLVASRSVFKLAEWCWILELHELETFARDESNYVSFGVPVLKRIAAHFEVEPPEKIKSWEDGKACSPDCEGGCTR